MNTLNTIIFVLLLSTLILLIAKVRKLKSNIVVNLEYAYIVFMCFYVLIPSYFLEYTNYLQRWNFSKNSVVFGKEYSIYFTAVTLILSVLLTNDKKLLTKVINEHDSKFEHKYSIYTELFWRIICFYSFFITVIVIIEFINLRGLQYDRVLFGSILDGISRKYSLRSVLYISFSLGTVKFWEKGKLYYFIPMILISLTDLIAGGRTLTFFMFLALYINITIKNRKLYIKQISICSVVLLASVTASRMSVQLYDPYLSKLSNFVYQSIGEFIQPYNGFVYVVENNFISHNSFFELVINLFQGILPGFLKTKLGVVDFFPGPILANSINRGYGLGFHLFAEAYYYGGVVALYLLPFISFYVIRILNNMTLKLKMSGLILYIYYLNYSRLFFREGIISYLILPIYLLVLYGFIAIFADKDVIAINHENKNGEFLALIKQNLNNIRKGIKTLKRNDLIIKIYNHIFARPIKNVLKDKNATKKALLSYSVYPFIKKNKRLIHPNYIEIYKITELLSRIGYSIDVFNNNMHYNIDYSQYDLIIGEGLPISDYFLKNITKKVKTVYYATGSHPIVNNVNSFQSIFDFYRAHDRLLLKSGRLVDPLWYIGSSLADEFIVIGNGVTGEGFRFFAKNENIHLINPPFYSIVSDVNMDKKSKSKYLWFGSYGLIHKGLNTVLDYFILNNELELHICGYIENEVEFFEVYKQDIKQHDNIYNHGFVDISSVLFKELMDSCSFVILTSVAEGLATSVITAMGNGGLIPIVTKETGIDTIHGIEVQENTLEALNEAIIISQKLTIDEVKSRSIENIKWVNSSFSEDVFGVNLENILANILCSEEI